MKLSHLAIAGALALGVTALVPEKADAFSGTAYIGGADVQTQIIPANHWNRDWRGPNHRRHWRQYPQYTYYYGRPAYYPRQYYQYPRYRHYGYRPGVSLNFRF